MLRLLFRIAGDSTPLQRTLAGIAPHAQAAGNKVAKKFHLGWSAGLAALGIGAVRAIGSVFSNALSHAMDSAREAASGTGITEEMQLLKQLSEESGAALEGLVKTLKQGGPAAEILRKQMGDIAKATGGPMVSDTVARLAFAQDRGREAGADVRNSAGWLIGGARHALDLIGSTAIGGVKGIGAMFSGGSFFDTVADEIAESLVGPETAMSRRQLEAGEAALAEQRRKIAEERERRIAKVNSPESEARRRKEAFGDFDDLKAPEGDALSKVGIFHQRSADEQKQWQQRSLDMLEKIEQRLVELKAAEMSAAQSSVIRFDP